MEFTSDRTWSSPVKLNCSAAVFSKSSRFLFAVPPRILLVLLDALLLCLPAGRGRIVHAASSWRCSLGSASPRSSSSCVRRRQVLEMCAFGEGVSSDGLLSSSPLTCSSYPLATATASYSYFFLHFVLLSLASMFRVPMSAAILLQNLVAIVRHSTKCSWFSSSPQPLAMHFVLPNPPDAATRKLRCIILSHATWSRGCRYVYDS